MNELSIISVLGPDDKSYIKKNISLIENLNKNSKKHIYLIDNFFDKDEKFALNDLNNVYLKKGVKQNKKIDPNFRGSYQHAKSLNKFLRAHKINTKYLLILDPDFYIIDNDWINKVISFMNTNNLDFFGSPWHPKWYTKYRNFPCVHCMFINLKKIDQGSLDFTPDLMSKSSLKKLNKKSKLKSPNVPQELKNYNWFLILLNMLIFSTRRLIYTYNSHKLRTPILLLILNKSLALFNKFCNKVIYKLLNHLKILNRLFFNRRFINSSKDTGYLIEKAYSNRKFSNYLIKPVVDYKDSFQMPHLKSKLGRNFEKFMPELISYLPNKKNYFASIEYNFEEFGLPPLYKNYKWEEFIWNNKPFGFHIRRFNKKNRIIKEELELIEKVTSKVLKNFE